MVLSWPILLSWQLLATSLPGAFEAGWLERRHGSDGAAGAGVAKHRLETTRSALSGLLQLARPTDSN